MAIDYWEKAKALADQVNDVGAALKTLTEDVQKDLTASDVHTSSTDDEKKIKKPITPLLAKKPVKKDLYDVGTLASLLSSLNSLQRSAYWEAQDEQDGSRVPARLKASVDTLCAILMDMAQEEVNEVVSSVSKAGARNSKTDTATLQMAHDLLHALGAQCEEPTVTNVMDGDMVKRDAEWTLPIGIAKVDADKNVVFGWANIVEKDGHTITDSQGDQIDIADLEDAAYLYVATSGEAGEMHQTTTGIGKLVESVVMTVEKQVAMGLEPHSTPLGWWCGFKMEPEIFAKVKDGTYKMFSIGGMALRSEVA